MKVYSISRWIKRKVKGHLETKYFTSAGFGIRNGRTASVGTASWADRNIGQPIRQLAQEKRTCTAYGKAGECKGTQGKTIQMFSLDLKGQQRPQEKGTRKHYEQFRRSLKGPENNRRTRPRETRGRMKRSHGIPQLRVQWYNSLAGGFR